MLNTKLGFFCVHSFAHLMNEVTKSYTKLTAVFSHILFALRVSTILDFGESGNRQPFLYPQENLPVSAKIKYRSMKKELILGAPSVPVLRIDAERFRKLLNRVLPAECQVKNATDCWYVGAAVSGVLSAMMPWLLPLAVYCVCRAKKGEKGGER